MLRLLPLIIVLAVSACSKGSPAAAAATQDTPGTAQADSAAPLPAAQPVAAVLPDVVARVNGEAVAKAEFEKAIQTVEGQNGSPVPAEQRDRIYRNVLDQIIGFKLLVQESKARKIAVPDAELDARIDEIRKQFPSAEAFTQTLTQQNLTVDQLRADARSEMMVTRMLQTEVDAKVAVTPAQVTDFYQKNTDKFQQAERVRASHILIGFAEGADAAAKQAAKAKADGVLKEVKAGKDFAALAKANSSDPGSAQNGGDLNFFEKGQMVAPFDQAAFTMKTGDTSELVETQFGYHIIRVTDKQAARAVPIDEVRTNIQQYLENQSRQAATEAFVNTLKAKGTIEVLM